MAAGGGGGQVAPLTLHPQPQQTNPGGHYEHHHPQQQLQQQQQQQQHHHQMHHASPSFVKTEEDELTSPHLTSHHPSSNTGNATHQAHHLPATTSPTSVYFHPGTNGAGAGGVRYSPLSHGGTPHHTPRHHCLSTLIPGPPSRSMITATPAQQLYKRQHVNLTFNP